MRDWSAAQPANLGLFTIPGCEVLLKPIFCVSYSSLRVKQVACCIRTPPFPPLQASYLTTEFFTHQVQGLHKLQGFNVEPGNN